MIERHIDDYMFWHILENKMRTYIVTYSLKHMLRYAGLGNFSVLKALTDKDTPFPFKEVEILVRSEGYLNYCKNESRKAGHEKFHLKTFYGAAGSMSRTTFEFVSGYVYSIKALMKRVKETDRKEYFEWEKSFVTIQLDSANAKKEITRLIRNRKFSSHIPDLTANQHFKIHSNDYVKHALITCPLCFSEVFVTPYMSGMKLRWRMTSFYKHVRDAHPEGKEKLEEYELNRRCWIDITDGQPVGPRLHRLMELRVNRRYQVNIIFCWE